MPRHSPCALISLTIFLVLNYARFSFEEFIVVFYLANFRLFVRILVCFPHCIYLLFSLFNFQDANSQTFRFVVGTSGLEPPTSRLSGVRSNHLSYAPILIKTSACSFSLFPFSLSALVEMRRIELLTPCVQGRCSPS